MGFTENCSTAQWFFNFFIISSVFIFLFIILLKVFRNASHPLRSSLALAAMSGVLCLPLLITAVPHVTLLNSADLHVTDSGNNMMSVSPLGTVVSSQGTDPALIRVLNILFLIWLAGCFFSLLRAVYGFVCAGRFSGHLIKIRDDKLESAKDQAREYFGIRKIPEVFLCRNIKSPVCTGFFRQRILIPSEIYRDISEAELKSIIFHETAHIVHRDNLVLILQKAAEALCWYNPFVYRVSEEFTRVREYVCDTYAAGFLKPQIYAESLISLVEKSDLRSVNYFVLNMAVRKSELKERIKNIISQEKKMKTKISGIVSIIIFIITITGTALIADQQVVFAQGSDTGISDVRSAEQDKDSDKETAEKEKKEKETKKVRKTEKVQSTEQEKKEKKSAEIRAAKKSKKEKVKRVKKSHRPKIIKRTAPVYPKEALKKQICGTVAVEATTDVYGRVKECKVVKSPDNLLSEAAVKALKQWVFEPYVIDGKPKPVKFFVNISFNLDRSKGKTVK